MRILVCWDDPQQLDLLRMYLAVDDNAVVATTNTAEFHSLLASPLTFDVVLLAAQLPDFETGFTIFERVQAARPNCPVWVRVPKAKCIGWRDS